MRSISVRITGMVQGVGFRPFVAEQAQALRLSGWVKNSGGIVIVRLVGPDEAVREWFHRLYHFTPAGARIDDVEVTELSMQGCLELNEESRSAKKRNGSATCEDEWDFVEDTGFRIIASSREEEDIRFLPPDLTICGQCERELFDSGNRRYRHPFISCTSCGPRYSILKDVPYDRENITMDRFPMCEECADEYGEMGNRRRHAQTIACHNCGPVIYASVRDRVMAKRGEAAIQKAVLMLKEEEVIAIKDIGGYHFACLAESGRAVNKIRSFKKRDEKPFAVMFLDLESVRDYCYVSVTEEKLLCSNERPIVLLERRKEFPVSVCGKSNRIGAMLPCNPLQLLLLRETGPLIMTSGNLGGEPIIIQDEAMLSLLRDGFPSLVLHHDREILEPLEDSIYQVSKKKSIVQLIRRARGLVPEPVFLKRELPCDCYAAGGDLKSVFAYGKKNVVYLSGSFGDLIHPEAVDAREYARERMESLLVLRPELMICDRHPNYISSRQVCQGQVSDEIQKRGTEWQNLLSPNVNLVQHHHAHIASVMAEHDLEGKVLGVAFDGTGYGDDGTVWGSEFLLCDGNSFVRKASLEPVAMPAGDATAKDAWIPALCYLDEAIKRGLVDREDVFDILTAKRRGQLSILHAARENGLGQIPYSSMGRFFDAAAAILGICEENSYEGECPAMLEQRAKEFAQNKDDFSASENENASSALRFLQSKEDMVMIDGVHLLTKMFQLKKEGVSENSLADFFHQLLSELVILVCEKICGKSIGQIALSGGTWYNQILLECVIEGLEKRGYKVYVNRKVPSGDGGLALGQMWLATFTF